MSKTNIVEIKEATDADYSDVMDIETSAFGHDKEANLVSELLRDESAKPFISLLAFKKDKPVGHILFTKAFIEKTDNHISVYLLAPLAVKPEYQKQGIGGLLIKEGLRILKERGAELVFVLGHKEYYPRYGFIQNAQSMGFPPPLPVPAPDAYAQYWMIQSLSDKGFDVQKGRVLCADTLYEDKYWRE